MEHTPERPSESDTWRDFNHIMDNTTLPSGLQILPGAADDTTEFLLADEEFLRMLSLPPTPDRDCHTAQVHPRLYEGMTTEETMDAWAMMVLGQQELRQFIAQATVDDQLATVEAERRRRASEQEAMNQLTDVEFATCLTAALRGLEDQA